MKLSHLEQTFADAERLHPDLMQPYSSRLAEAETAIDRVGIMRAGLREAFRRRYPMADELWPKRPEVAA